MKEITKEEEQVFDVITSAYNLCLIKGTLKTEEVTIITLIDKKNGFKLYPLAILLNDAMKTNLKPDEKNFIITK